jgi:hypothetical protein
MTTALNYFILEAFDPDLLCPWLAQRFATSDLDLLRKLLDVSEADQLEIDGQYLLAPHETDAVCAAFGVEFSHGDREVILFRQPAGSFASTVPYLLHGGYELALMVHGTKPFAFIHYDSDYEGSREYKARFDHYVAQGLLYSENEIEVVDEATGRRRGRVFYTLKGEEWRIPALKFIFGNLKPTDNGFEIRERLEGTLLGYEQWQNDWWLEQHAVRGGVMYGMSFRCALNRAQFADLSHAGFHCLPRFEGDTFQTLEAWNDKAIEQAMDDDASIEAIVQFSLGGRHLMNVINLREGGPYTIPTSIIPTINLHLSRSIVVLRKRERS